MNRILVENILKNVRYHVSSCYNFRKSSTYRTRRARSLLPLIAGIAVSAGALVYLLPRESTHPFYEKLTKHVFHRLDPEIAHRLSTFLAHYVYTPSSNNVSSDLSLKVNILNLSFDHPIGLAAGYSKNGEAIQSLSNLGFSSVEIGTITPLAQLGNDKPRVFRLMGDQAIINRYGFNSKGVHYVASLISPNKKTILGINIGKNKSTPLEQAADDYETCVKALLPFADYFVINVSSPNTPGLRTLQTKEHLKKIVQKVNQANEKRLPIFIKVAPGLSLREKKEISELALKGHIQGIIVSNTTTERPSSLTSPLKSETGGLSGKPLFEASTKDLADFCRLTKKKIPLIGVGGVFTGEDAYQKIRQGASLVQIYSSLIFRGPGAPAFILDELKACMNRDGVERIQDIIGIDVK